MSTPTINDLKRMAYMNQLNLSSGTLNDLERMWLIDELELGDAGYDWTLGDLWRAFLEAVTGLSGDRTDLAKVWLENGGYTGWVSDMIMQFFRGKAYLSFQTLGPKTTGEIDTSVMSGAGSETFTRASDAMLRDWENNYTTVPSGEARIQGARRVENLLTYSEDLSNSAWTKEANITVEDQGNGEWKIVPDAAVNRGVFQSYSGNHSDETLVGSVEMRADTPVTIRLTDPGNSTVWQDIEVGTEWKRYNFKWTPLGISSTGLWIKKPSANSTPWFVRFPQLEDVSGQTDTSPGPYVSRDVDTGTEYVTNGQFTSDLSGWDDVSAAGGSVAWNASGYVDITNTTGDGWIEQSMTVVVGKRYRVAFNNPNSTQNVHVYIGTVSKGAQYITAAVSAGDSYSTIIESTSTTLYVGFREATAGTTSSADNVTVQEVTNGIKYFWNCPQYEVAENLLKYSREYNKGAYTRVGVTFYDNPYSGYDGTAGGQIVADESASGSYLYQSATVTDDSRWVYSSIFIRKNSGTEGIFPRFDISLTGGTTQTAATQFNTYTGDISTAGSATVDIRVEDHGEYWKLIQGIKNNSSGNTTSNQVIYIAFTDVWGGGQNTSLNNQLVIDQKQRSYNTAYETQVETTTTAITDVVGQKTVLYEPVDQGGFTIYQDTGLSANFIAHPTVIKEGARLFATYAQWQASTAYSVGDRIIPATGSGPAGGNGYYYECTTAGTSDSSEPTFGTEYGGSTSDNTVVWECLGYYRIAGYHAEPQRTNEIDYSYDLTNWTQSGTAVSALDATGIDGVANKATTLTDDDGAGYEFVSKNITIPNDSNTHTVYIIIEKDNDETRFPALYVELTGGTLQAFRVNFNTKTGATQSRVDVGTNDHWVEDLGTHWKLVYTLKNNSTGNVTLSARMYPAITTIITTEEVSATGSCVVGHTQLELNTSIPSSPIETNGATATRSEDNLWYSSDSMSDLQGTNIINHTVIQPAATYPIVGHSAIRMYPGMYGVNGSKYRVRSYDGSNADVSSLGVNTNVLAQPNGDEYKISVRWSDSQFNSAVSTLDGLGTSTPGSAYNGSFLGGASYVKILDNSFSIVIGFVKNFCMYNKDLGQTRTEALTAYD